MITTALLLCVAILMKGIIKKINPKVSLILLPLLTAVCIGFLHLNQNYYVSGTVAYIFTLAGFLLYLHIERPF